MQKGRGKKKKRKGNEKKMRKEKVEIEKKDKKKEKLDRRMGTGKRIKLPHMICKIRWELRQNCSLVS